MKDRCVEDSDPYDSTSASEEEYVPESTAEEGDSDASLSLKKTPCKSLDWLQSECSPILCDSSTTNVDINSTDCQIAEEQPSSSQGPNDVVVVDAFDKNDGKRVYNKRQHCMYCSKPYAKISRHLESAHSNQMDVAKALSFPKGSKERKIKLDYLRKKGNYAHNATVLETGKGQLVPCKRPPKQAQGVDFMHCAFCQGLFSRKTLWRHIRICKLKPATHTPKTWSKPRSGFMYIHWAGA